MKEKTVNVNTISVPALLTIVFVVLKLIGKIAWSWIWVLSPLWISVGLAIVIFIIIVIVAALAD